MAAMHVHDPAHHVKAKTIDFLGIAILAVSVSALQYFVDTASAMTGSTHRS